MRPDVITVQGRPARLWRGGAGAPVILLQGGMADAELHWAPIWDRLAERFEVFAPDWPGFGGTAGLDDSSFAAMLDWLEAFQAATGAAPAHVVGNSFGGTLARLMAAERPHAVRRAVLINGGGMVPEATAQALRAVPADRAFLDQAGRAAFSRDALARMVADEATLTDAFVAACQSNPVILSILRQSLTGAPPLQTACAVPTLVLWGEADRHTPLAMGRDVAAAIPGAQFRTVAAAGHLPQVERPAAVADALIDFLTDTDCRTRTS
jgi:2-hydroxy-6-oxonona-2,4-dienedioate hydrolase